MQKIVLRYGLISGAILAAFVALMVPFCMNADFEHGEIVGYSSMVLAFLLVFFGVRSYRENIAHGTIGFGKALQVGLLIVLVACAMYVIAWEITYFNFVPDFMEKFNAHMLDKMRADGKTQAEIQTATVKMADFAKSYANPLFNVAVTFMEVFPVGLIMALVSAAILRKKPRLAAPAEVGMV
ncbi:MAG TPA: DUF4199 domain-containing protein [Thermoanaerobaculia bacterium]|jgi:hypothetical protein|nr:DUF4199 domain-containing protein [Thermoanaerobaculia bacterium]